MERGKKEGGGGQGTVGVFLVHTLWTIMLHGYKQYNLHTSQSIGHDNMLGLSHKHASQLSAVYYDVLILRLNSSTRRPRVV